VAAGGGDAARLAAVERQMRSAYFGLFSVPAQAGGDVPIPAKLPLPFSLLPSFLTNLLLAGVQVHEAPHRFQVALEEAACQLLAINQVGQPVAKVDIDWTPIPWDYPANPYTKPPQTILNPFVSQRFEMLNGKFSFDDPQGTSIHGFGSGRTFPNYAEYLSGAIGSLNIGAVIDVLEGYGRFAGHNGLMVVNGVITPPQALDLNIMMRILDPGGELLATEPLPPLVATPYPTNAGTFMMLMAEPDPQRPSTLRLGADGQVVGVELREVLRAVALDFDVVPVVGPKSQVQVGRVVGRARATLDFPVAAGASGLPIPVQSSGGEFELYDDQLGLCFGTVRADLVEGRGLPTPGTGLPAPLYRVGGFGPIQGGTGEFTGAGGIVSVNSVLSLSPLTFSNLYVLRFLDQQGKYRPYPGSPGSGGS
jgi:hypothetical protein